MLRRKRWKSYQIGQSAAKPRTEEGSTTILYGVRYKLMIPEAGSISNRDDDIVCSCRKLQAVIIQSRSCEPTEHKTHVRY